MSQVLLMQWRMGHMVPNLQVHLAEEIDRKRAVSICGFSSLLSLIWWLLILYSSI